MPIYEYRCMDCGKASEVLLRNPDSESIKCPACGSGNLERLLSASYNIRMKGFTPGRTAVVEWSVVKRLLAPQMVSVGGIAKK